MYLANCAITLANYQLTNCHIYTLYSVMFSCKSYHNLFQIVILQIATFVPSKLYCNLLQTVISQIVLLALAMKYGLITKGAAVDLKSVTSIRAHLDRLSLDDVS